MPRTAHRVIPYTLAMVQPACRMVAVVMYANRDAQGEWLPETPEIFPVVALVARTGFAYEKRVMEGQYPAGEATHRGMSRQGWHYVGHELVYDALIMDTEFGLSETRDTIGDMGNGECEIVCCAWPESEDADRLAPVVERLRGQARVKVERREALTPAV